MFQVSVALSMNACVYDTPYLCCVVLVLLYLFCYLALFLNSLLPILYIISLAGVFVPLLLSWKKWDCVVGIGIGTDVDDICMALDHVDFYCITLLAR